MLALCDPERISREEAVSLRAALLALGGNYAWGRLIGALEREAGELRSVKPFKPHDADAVWSAAKNMVAAAAYEDVLATVKNTVEQLDRIIEKRK